MPERSHENVMDGAAPIFIEQGETAILFLHGFTGSPYEGRPLADYFGKKGLAVWVPLLPGHGTQPQDLETVTYQDWLTAAEQYYREMKSRYRRVIVCGQSMGGALALHLAANYPVDALVTLAAVVFVQDWRLKFLPLAKRLFRYQHKSKGPDIHSKDAKTASASYSKYPFSSISEFLKLIEVVRDELSRVSAPCLLVHSQKDRTIRYENLDFISRHISSQVKRTLTLTNSYHVISVDLERMEIFRVMEEFISGLSWSSPARKSLG